jgi:hypothetical protein
VAVVTKAEREARRRAEAEAQRAREEAQQRRRLIFIIAGAVATAIVIVIIFLSSDGRFGGGWAKPKATTGASRQIVPAAPESSTSTKQATVRAAANPSGIHGVLAWDTQGWPGDGSAHPGALEHDHVTGPVDYGITPPVGGPHNAIWMNAGVYTKPVPTERAVHNLEHGAVWITYDPDLSASDVKALTAFVGKQSMIAENEQQTPGQENRYVDLSPWTSNTLPSPIVISSWGYQLRVTSPTDPRLQKFVNTFRDSQKYSPEFGSPVDGVPVQTGGRPAEFGSLKANPSGSVG